MDTVYEVSEYPSTIYDRYETTENGSALSPKNILAAPQSEKADPALDDSMERRTAGLLLRHFSNTPVELRERVVSFDCDSYREMSSQDERLNISMRNITIPSDFFPELSSRRSEGAVPDASDKRRAQKDKP